MTALNAFASQSPNSSRAHSALMHQYCITEMLLRGDSAPSLAQHVSTSSRFRATEWR